MKVIILEHTPNPDSLVATAARQCYSPGFVGDNYHTETANATKLVEKVISMGHTSVLEHASFTFAIGGVSRALSHQLVRFRIASFSQQSQRYCSMENAEFVTPESIIKASKLKKYNTLMTEIWELYDELVGSGVPNEDARFVLPNACETNIVMTMNARELLHAFRLRCCTHAQWEIRNMFNLIKEEVKKIAPAIFAHAGAPCECGDKCPEGERSCKQLKGDE